MDSFEAGQPNSVETAFSNSDGFESIRTVLKRAGWLQNCLDSFKMVFNIYTCMYKT